MRAGDQGKADGPTLESFIQNLPGNVYRRVRKLDGTYLFEYLSSGLFRQFAIDNERLLAQRPVTFDWVHPEDRTRFIADLELSAATLGLLDHRIRVVGATGHVYWARGIARPSRRPDGSVVWDGIVIDVTREVEAEAALRIAKADADGAQASAAQLVTETAQRLEAPVAALHGFVADARASLGPQLAQRLDTLLANIEVALNRIRPQGMPRFPTTPGTDRADDGRPGRAPALTGRQLQVLTLLRAGLTNKQIAAKLGITPGTAKLHVSAILKTLDAADRRQLRHNGAAAAPTV